VKQRVHIDVHAASVDEVLARGATPSTSSRFRWKRAEDPRAASVRLRARGGAAYKLYEVVVDCA
jgi:hypothetical protein